MTVEGNMQSKRQDEKEPFFITEVVDTELVAAGYEFKPPGHARTKSLRDLYGWQFGETLNETIRRYLGRADAASGCKSRGEDV